jgi:hypothetical protein
MPRINIELPEELHKKAKVICAMHGKTLKDYIVAALDDKLSKEKAKID